MASRTSARRLAHSARSCLNASVPGAAALNAWSAHRRRSSTSDGRIARARSASSPDRPSCPARAAPAAASSPASAAPGRSPSAAPAMRSTARSMRATRRSSSRPAVAASSAARAAACRRTAARSRSSATDSSSSATRDASESGGRRLPAARSTTRPLRQVAQPRREVGLRQTVGGLVERPADGARRFRPLRIETRLEPLHPLGQLVPLARQRPPRRAARPVAPGQTRRESRAPLGVGHPSRLGLEIANRAARASVLACPQLPRQIPQATRRLPAGPGRRLRVPAAQRVLRLAHPVGDAVASPARPRRPPARAAAGVRRPRQLPLDVVHLPAQLLLLPREPLQRAAQGLRIVARVRQRAFRLPAEGILPVGQLPDAPARLALLRCRRRGRRGAILVVGPLLAPQLAIEQRRQILARLRAEPPARRRLERHLRPAHLRLGLEQPVQGRHLGRDRRRRVVRPQGRRGGAHGLDRARKIAGARGPASPLPIGRDPRRCAPQFVLGGRDRLDVVRGANRGGPGVEAPRCDDDLLLDPDEASDVAAGHRRHEPAARLRELASERAHLQEVDVAPRLAGGPRRVRVAGADVVADHVAGADAERFRVQRVGGRHLAGTPRAEQVDRLLVPAGHRVDELEALRRRSRRPLAPRSPSPPAG